MSLLETEEGVHSKYPSQTALQINTSHLVRIAQKDPKDGPLLSESVTEFHFWQLHQVSAADISRIFWFYDPSYYGETLPRLTINGSSRELKLVAKRYEKLRSTGQLSPKFTTKIEEIIAVLQELRPLPPLI